MYALHISPGLCAAPLSESSLFVSLLGFISIECLLLCGASASFHWITSSLNLILM